MSHTDQLLWFIRNGAPDDQQKQVDLEREDMAERWDTGDTIMPTDRLYQDGPDDYLNDAED